MAVLLHIDASARKERSISRALAKEFNRQWLLNRPQDTYLYRDIGTTPPDFVSENWIAAAFVAKEDRTDEQNSLLALSDSLIQELSQADVVVIATPMYNYGMPASLKAWVDQIVRVNETFSFDLGRGDFPLKPTMSGKSLVLLTSSGEFGFGDGGMRENMNHLGPHLRTVSKYFGVDEIHEINIEYQEFGDARHQHSVEKAYQTIPKVIQEIGSYKE